MTGVTGTRPEWRATTAPLSPRAVVAIDALVPLLQARLLMLPDAQLSDLHGVYARFSEHQVLAILGEENALPWIDGAHYFGVHQDAPRLLLPCNLDVSLSPSLLQQAVVARGLPSPTLVIPETNLFVPCDCALPIVRSILQELGG